MVKKNEIGFRIKILKVMQLFLNVLLESEMTYFAIFFRLPMVGRATDMFNSSFNQR